MEKMNISSNKRSDMAAEEKREGFRLSRRRLILSTTVGALVAINGVVLAWRANWKWLDSLLGLFRSKPTVAFRFTGPFQNDVPLLNDPPKNDWVGIENVFAITCDDSPTTKDMFKFVFDFLGETKKTVSNGKILVDPYAIAVLIVIEDKHGGEHVVTDDVVVHQPRTYQFQFGGGQTYGGGDPRYGGPYILPIKLKDASAIRVRLTKVSG